jgi:hypothetical protein
MANPTVQDMVEAINSSLKLDEEFALSEWETDFFISIEAQVKRGRSLSEKQVESLTRIYDRT